MLSWIGGLNKIFLDMVNRTVFGHLPSWMNSFWSFAESNKLFFGICRDRKTFFGHLHNQLNFFVYLLGWPTHFWTFAVLIGCFFTFTGLRRLFSDICRVNLTVYGHSPSFWTKCSMIKPINDIERLLLRLQNVKHKDVYPKFESCMSFPKFIQKLPFLPKNWITELSRLFLDCFWTFAESIKLFWDICQA